jgi:uncharacterized protein (TIRG00374 family)
VEEHYLGTRQTHRGRGRSAGLIAAEAAIVILLGILLLRSVDPSHLRDGLARVSLGAAAGVIAFQLVLISLASVCWTLVLRGAGYRSPWHRALGANLAGFAVTYLTPAITCSGAPVRAALLREPAAPLSPLLATIALDTLVLAAGKIPTMVTGAAILLCRAPLRPALAAGAALAVFVALIVVGLVSLLRGGRLFLRMARWGVRPLARIRRRAAVKVILAVRGFVDGLQRQGTAGGLVTRALAVAVVIGLVEVGQNLFVLAALGTPSLAGAFAVHTGVLVQGIIGILPGNLGGMEAVNALAFSMFGLDASAGVIYSLVLRMGQLSLVVLGLGVLAASRLRRPGSSQSRPARVLCTHASPRESRSRAGVQSA